MAWAVRAVIPLPVPVKPSDTCAREKEKRLSSRHPSRAPLANAVLRPCPPVPTYPTGYMMGKDTREDKVYMKRSEKVFFCQMRKAGRCEDYGRPSGDVVGDEKDCPYGEIVDVCCLSRLWSAVAVAVAGIRGSEDGRDGIEPVDGCRECRECPINVRDGFVRSCRRRRSPRRRPSSSDSRCPARPRRLPRPLRSPPRASSRPRRQTRGLHRSPSECAAERRLAGP